MKLVRQTEPCDPATSRDPWNHHELTPQSTSIVHSLFFPTAMDHEAVFPFFDTEAALILAFSARSILTPPPRFVSITSNADARHVPPI